MGTVIHLIGSGESAAAVEPDELEGLTIGLNDAGLHKPCKLWFSLDIPYVASRWGQVLARYRPEQIHLCGHQRQRVVLDDLHMGRRANWWQRLQIPEPSIIPPACLSSGKDLDLGCTGVVAINLAARLGADEIRLHGFDFHDDYRYFYQAELFPRLHVGRVRDLFERMAPWYVERGIRVLNMNPNSSIKAFPCAPTS